MSGDDQSALAFLHRGVQDVLSFQFNIFIVISAVETGQTRVFSADTAPMPVGVKGDFIQFFHRFFWESLAKIIKRHLTPDLQPFIGEGADGHSQRSRRLRRQDSEKTGQGDRQVIFQTVV